MEIIMYYSFIGVECSTFTFIVSQNEIGSRILQGVEDPGIFFKSAN